MTIQSFKCNNTRILFETGSSSVYTSIHSAAQRKLAILDGAKVLTDLAQLPGNKLHQLSSDRAGQHAIRINDQYRICFTWTQAGPDAVEIIDYH